MRGERRIGRKALLVGTALGLALAGPARAQEDACTPPAGEATLHASGHDVDPGTPRVDDRPAESAALALGERALAYHRAGRTPEALTLTRRALFQAQSAREGRAIAALESQLADLLGATGDAVGALEARRRAVGTLERLRPELAREAGVARHSFRREIQPVYLALVGALLDRADLDSNGADGLRREAIATLESFRAAELRDHFRDECLAAVESVEAGAIPGATIVYPIPLEDRLELLVQRAGRLEHHRQPVGREALAEAAATLRYALEDAITRSYLRTARDLYDWLIRPIAPEGFADGRDADETLVFVLPAELRSVPMAALYDREAEAFLVEQMPLVVTPGLSLTEPRAVSGRARRLLAAGLTESVQGFDALPNVGQELDALDRLFEGTELRDGGFRTEVFARQVEERPFDVVHVASHGVFSGDARESYLLTHDGRLTFERISDALRGTAFRTETPLELLVLSACETAAGDERASLGLAGAALRAGARSVVATLWLVNDEASARLVERFYTELADGVSRAEAIRRAQRSLIDSEQHAHPNYWAPYLLIGSWL